MTYYYEQVITGTGGKAGEVPTDLEQATGLERMELLYKLKGEDAFSVEPLEVIRMGTLVAPIEVFSLVSLNSFTMKRGRERNANNYTFSTVFFFL